jgi:hypothetical protein
MEKWPVVLGIWMHLMQLYLELQQKPGECMSIDQLNATTPGLIAQLKGYLQSKVQMC